MALSPSQPTILGTQSTGLSRRDSPFALRPDCALRGDLNARREKAPFWFGAFYHRPGGKGKRGEPLVAACITVSRTTGSSLFAIDRATHAQKGSIFFFGSTGSSSLECIGFRSLRAPVSAVSSRYIRKSCTRTVSRFGNANLFNPPH